MHGSYYEVCLGHVIVLTFHKQVSKSCKRYTI